MKKLVLLCMSLALCGCVNGENDKCSFVSTAISSQITIAHERVQIIGTKTTKLENSEVYYTELIYKFDFMDDVYYKFFVSYFDETNELITKEAAKGVF